MAIRPRHLAAFGALLLLLPDAALAASATATQNVNVRSGPATTYGVVAQLHQGDAVDVRQCEGLFCQVSFSGGAGWVSASYLTRDAVARPAPASIPAPQFAATPKPLPTIPPASPTHVATVTPTGAPPRPLGTLPPAYDGNTAQAPNDRLDSGSETWPSPAEDSRSAATLPDDDGDVIASSGPGDVPRPKAEIPGGLSSGPADDGSMDGADATDDDAYPPPEAAMPPEMVVPPDDWRYGPGPDHGRFGRFGQRGRFADIAPVRPRDEACFFGESGFAGGDGFCVAAGQSLHALGDWSGRIVALRNPGGLRVTVCTAGPAGACRVYTQSGPLLQLAHADLASISVDPPGRY